MRTRRAAILVAALAALPPGCERRRRKLDERQARVLATRHYNDRRRGPQPLDADGRPVPSPELTVDSWQEVSRTTDGGWELTVEVASGTRITARLDRSGDFLATWTILPPDIGEMTE